VAGLIGIMQAIWRDVLRVAEVDPEDDFFALGGDSLTSINVVARAREEGVIMKPTDLFDFPRLAELCERISEEAEEREAADFGGSMLRSRNVGGSARPFFMVHGGGRLLAQLQGSLGPEQPIHLLSAHWEQGDLAIDVSMEQLADEALGRLLETQPEGPYAIGGYSFGAIIAYEIALRLLARGDAVELLFMLDPPENPDVFGGVPEACRGLQRQGDNPRAGASHRDRLRGMGPLEALRYAAGKLKGHAGHYASRLLINGRHSYALACRRMGLPVPPDLRKLYVFRRYMAAAGRYRLQPIDCRILLYRARFGHHKYGVGLWRELARGGLSLEEFDCEHDDLQWKPEVVEQWTARFGAQFESARAGAGPAQPEA
jgi:thioesterase domain-containing protein